MKIVGLVADPASATMIISWARRLAEPGDEVSFLCVDTEADGPTRLAVREALGEREDGREKLVTIDDPRPVPRVLEHLRRNKADVLLTGPLEYENARGETETEVDLARAAPCYTLAFTYGHKLPADVRRLLVVVTQGEHNRAMLRLAKRLSERGRVHVTIGGVEDETGAKAGRMGEAWVRRLLHEEALDDETFEIKVVVDRLKHRGVMKLFDEHDLIVTGLDARNRVRPLQQTVGDTTVVLVRRTPPLSRRGISEWVPTINPVDHAHLLHDMQAGSTWGPDFVGMLGLASAIASLGLLQNSPAVVIGSMLLAPLMTPMIGLGLGLGQANPSLSRQCGRSIVLGFLLTLVVSYCVGQLIPSGATLPDEVLARGGPNVLDLFIAVFAAAAATFAMARPGIAGAIAGVAIATALVPPLCAAGISLAHKEWLTASGAATLFVTNLVAIIVTSSFTFSLLGITSQGARPRFRRTSTIVRVGLVVLLLGLIGPLTSTLVTQIDLGKSVSLAYPVTKSVSEALFARVAQDDGVELTFLGRLRGENRVIVHIAAHEELPESYASELRQIVRETMKDPEAVVTVVALRGYWRSDSDPVPVAAE